MGPDLRKFSSIENVFATALQSQHILRIFFCSNERRRKKYIKKKNIIKWKSFIYILFLLGQIDGTTNPF